jgi:hypothetical protein
VKHPLTSVVREICTLRSVGAGERATALGHPVALSNERPYRDSNPNVRFADYSGRLEPVLQSWLLFDNWCCLAYFPVRNSSGKPA